MSHFTSATTQITQLTDLRAACAALNLTLIEPDLTNPAERDGTVPIRGWANQVRRVAAKLGGEHLNRFGYEIGFRLTDAGTYELIADWMGASVAPHTLAAQLNNEAALAAALEEVAALGYDAEVVRDPDGTIRVIAAEATY